MWLYILSIAFPLLPILWVIVETVGTKRRHSAAERAKLTVAAAPPAQPAEAALRDPKAFHEAEFTALKSEIVELVKAAAANFQYAVLSSGAIFAWIVAARSKSDEVSLIKFRSDLLPLALWLPFPRHPLYHSLTS